MNNNDVKIQNEFGDTITIELTFDGERNSSQLFINGVWYHFEQIKPEELISQYKVDQDPDYKPRLDATGHCYILAPFME
ncbi:MAG: hypothetical protein IPM66_19315 [Acidobacteriota bacterium]|nr:MAG: hypothetical protein IPM66_19315 [Acidobacteriota bacterium]